MIVPFSPGSAADNSMRPFTRVLSQKLGQTVVIDNKPGAGGILGMEIGAAAKPDGYTLIFGSSGPMATFSSLYKKLSYDPAKSFIAIRAGALEPLCDGVQSGETVQDAARVHRLREEEPGQDQLRIGRHRLQRASRRRTAAAADRHQDDARALQGSAPR